MSKENELKKIIDDTLWMAIRYAHGRHTYAPGMVREAVEKMQELYPDWKLRSDPTIEAPEEVIGLRRDYLDDLFFQADLSQSINEKKQ